MEDIFRDVVEGMAVGVLILDRGGEVVFANRAARLLKGSGVSVDGRTLEQWVRSTRGDTAVERALCGDGLAHVAARAAGELRVIFIWTFPREFARLEASLIDLYALTPQEARLAVLLYARGSLAVAGSELNISVWTARTHLKSIFIKTATRKQSQLVLLVATCALYSPGREIGVARGSVGGGRAHAVGLEPRSGGASDRVHVQAGPSR